MHGEQVLAPAAPPDQELAALQPVEVPSDWSPDYVAGPGLPPCSPPPGGDARRSAPAAQCQPAPHQFALLIVLPDAIPKAPITIAAALAFYKLADSMQGDAFTQHRAAGGDRQSNWVVFGLTIGTAAAVIVILFVAITAMMPRIDISAGAASGGGTAFG